MPNRTLSLGIRPLYKFLLGLVIISTVGITQCIASDYPAIVSSPGLWSMIHTQGEICELWTGPPDAGGTNRGAIPSPLRVSIYGMIHQDQDWLDLRSLDYSLKGSHPGHLTLTNKQQGISIEISAGRNSNDDPLVIHYTFSSPCDFRFCINLLDTAYKTPVDSNNAHGYAKITGDTWGPLWIASTPAGKFLTSEEKDKSLTSEFKNISEATICLKAGERTIDSNLADNLAGMWLRESNSQDSSQHRIRIHTGIDDFDEMLEASIDAIETNRFGNGVIIAGSDGGFYKGTWIRDGVYAVLGYGLTGNHEAVDEFFRYWILDKGFSFGGENEAQQPAIAILGLWYYSHLRANGETFLQDVYPYVRHYADYYAERVAREGMIHTAEEWICQVPTQTSWPNAEVYAGLFAASQIATAIGKTEDAARWSRYAADLREAIIESAYDKKLERFIPLAGKAGEIHPPEPHEAAGGPMRDERVDSGMLMLARLEIFGDGLGVVAVDDPRFAATQAWIHRVLEQPDHAISRFDGNLDSPHYAKGEWNVWPISTCWAAQVEWLRGRTDRAWRYLLSGIVRKDGYEREKAMNYLPEYWSLEGRTATSTRFLTWSHGELLTSSILLLLGLDTEIPDADLALAPSLPMESQQTTIEGFRFRDWNLNFNLKRDGHKIQVKGAAQRIPSGHGPQTLRIKLPEQIIEVAGGDSFEFQINTDGQSSNPSRSGNASERAQLYDRILLAEELSPDLKDATLEELEAHLRKTEDRFDRERLQKERIRRKIELIDLNTASGESEENVLTLTLPNDVELKFCKIPAGRFVMGSAEDEPGHSADESPAHEVEFKEPFYLGMFEVTQAQWEAVMGANPSRFSGFPNRPVESITWHNCQSFIEKLNTLGLGTFRLPTEAEWEYACRAGTETPYFWGNDPNGTEIKNYAWYDGNSGARAHDAGTLRPNPWGLYDLCGNVWEWCADAYAPYSLGNSTNASVENANIRYVLRGGSWRLYSGYCRSAQRAAITPGYRYRDTGLRLHRTYP